MKFSEMEYARPNMPALEEQFNELLSKFEQSGSYDEQATWFKKIYNLRDDFQTQASIASVRNSIDTGDKFYETEQEFFDVHEPVIKNLNIQFYKALGGSKFKPQLENKYGVQLFRQAATEVKTFDTSIIDDLKEENKLGTEYTKLIARFEIMFNGKKHTMPAMDAYSESPDRELRKAAWTAKWNEYAKHEAKFDEIFDKLVKLRTSMAHKLGYKNFIELAYNRMGRTDYDAAMVASYRELILKHVVPLTVKLRERQRERTGLDQLKAYDWGHNFNSGNPAPHGTPEQIVANGQKMYSELSAETKEFFDYMVNNGLMDLVNKTGKAAGGYCTIFNKYRAPFIFANFNGTIGDVDVLTHEAGHAFQCYESRGFEVEEYLFPTKEACEIHSMSMEHLTYPWMELFFGADTEKYKFVHLSGAVLFLPYGASIDEFQHIIYEDPDLTPAERKAVMRDLDKKYRPWADYDGLSYVENGGLWHRQGHVFRSPFYYIDYCLAQSCAFQFWSKSRSDFKKAWQDYLRLCKAGGSQSFLELVNLAGLQSPFDARNFAAIFKEMETYLDSVNDRTM